MRGIRTVESVAVSRDVLSTADAAVVCRALCVHRQARLFEQGCAPADLGVSWASTVMPCDVAGAVFVHGRWLLSNVSWSQRCSRSEAAPCAIGSLYDFVFSISLFIFILTLF